MKNTHHNKIIIKMQSRWCFGRGEIGTPARHPFKTHLPKIQQQIKIQHVNEKNTHTSKYNTATKKILKYMTTNTNPGNVLVPERLAALAVAHSNLASKTERATDADYVTFSPGFPRFTSFRGIGEDGGDLRGWVGFPPGSYLGREEGETGGN